MVNCFHIYERQRPKINVNSLDPGICCCQTRYYRKRQERNSSWVDPADKICGHCFRRNRLDNLQSLAEKTIFFSAGCSGKLQICTLAYHDLENDGLTPVLAQFLVDHILDNTSKVKKKPFGVQLKFLAQFYSKKGRQRRKGVSVQDYRNELQVNARLQSTDKWSLHQETQL